MASNDTQMMDEVRKIAEQNREESPIDRRIFEMTNGVGDDGYQNFVEGLVYHFSEEGRDPEEIYTVLWVIVVGDSISNDAFDEVIPSEPSFVIAEAIACCIEHGNLEVGEGVSGVDRD